MHIRLKKLSTIIVKKWLCLISKVRGEIVVNVTIYKSVLNGKVEVPSFKSQLHRAIICAGLSSDVSYIKNICMCEDIKVTINAIIALGADVQFYIDDNTKKECLRIKGVNYKNIGKVTINCQNSATTFRLFLSIVAVLGIETKFILSKELMARPFEHLTSELVRHGVEYRENRKECYIISKGKVLCEDFFIRGDISSQYISSLLISLPLISKASEDVVKIYITSKLESYSYVELTIDVLSNFGVKIEKNKQGYSIPTNQKFKATTIDLEGDYSLGANFLVARNINSPNLVIKNLDVNSLQGDALVLEILDQIKNEDRILIDGSNCIDVVPILAVLGCYTNIEFKFFNVARLRFKESNRLHAICESINKMGGNICFTENEFVIKGTRKLKGGVSLDGYKDHRMVMALAIAGLNCEEPITISNAEYVNKSFPEFWNELKKLGAKITEE